jgi:hypothetical protein
MKPPSLAARCLPMLLALAALALSLGGCGGGSSTAAPGRGNASTSTSATTGAGQSKPSFIARADVVCARINTEIAAIKAKGTSAAEVKRVVPRTLSLERAGMAALEELKPPTSLVQSWLRMLAYRRTLAKQLSELLELAEKNDGTSVKPLAAAKKRAHAGLSQVAKASGFKDCAKVGRVG